MTHFHSRKGHGGVPPPLAPVRLVPRLAVIERNDARLALEEGVVALNVVVVGQRSLLLHGRFVAVEYLPAAVDDVQRRFAAHVELSNLGASDSFALLVSGTNGVEVRIDVREGQTQQLRELAHPTEPVVLLPEDTLQDLEAPEELVRYVPRFAQW